jgi:hypothetical protein
MRRGLTAGGGMVLGIIFGSSSINWFSVWCSVSSLGALLLGCDGPGLPGQTDPVPTRPPTRSEYSQALVSVARFGSSRGVTTRTVERLESSLPQHSRWQSARSNLRLHRTPTAALLHSKFPAFGARSAPVKLRR